MWVILLGIWLVRLPVDKLYANKAWVSLWITSRVILRLGMGVFGVLAWESYRNPSPPPAYVLIIENGCPEAWQGGYVIAQRLFRQGERCGLLAVTPRSAFWAIPPTADSGMFFKLYALLEEKVLPRSQSLSEAAALSQLRPFLQEGSIGALLWLGRFQSASKEGMYVPFCQDKAIDAHALSLPSLSVPESVWYGLGFLLCAGLLLIGEGYFYFMRKHLPLRLQA
ncbi:MAG: hypothetical protein N2253_06310 [Bacteroidia bacterium]|nr:hypothetical protein [Bacteroidia bacterium]MCX7764484.1 hypothetical protein [Bacteroidia bacterium]MDW8057937.1 hypothetical protein [Bacteroidia bacterium]